MTNREKLQENYEDSVIALLMDEFAESEGNRYIEENERLLQDPDAAMPEEIETRALQFIAREFSRKNRAHAGGKLLRFLGRIAIAAVIAALLFGVAFALSETVRVGTLNFLMQMDEKIATWQFMEDEGDASDGQSGMLDIEVDWLPEGFARQAPVIITPKDIVWDYTNVDGDIIRISVHESEDFMHFLDLEDADDYEEVTVQGCEGMLRIKDGILRIAWPYQNSGLVICIISSSGIDEDSLLKVANGVSVIR